MDGAAESSPVRLDYPWEEPPAPGEAIEVAEGVLWLRLPLPMALDHVNCYALDEGDHWSIVDTGVHSKRSVEMWETLLAGPLKGKPVGRVILTHHHPDHVGMIGWFMARGAALYTSRTAYLMARMLILDKEDTHSDESIAYWKAAGMAPEILEKRLSERPFNFADICAPLPVGFTRLKDGDTLHAAGRTWDVRTGNGHAPEHLTFWSRDDNLVLAGDQVISSISPNIGVYPAEPDADPLAEWLESCAALAEHAREDQLVLSGHKLPFTGMPLRLHQLIENHESALRRLEKHLAEPKVATECFPPLFKRRVDEGIYGMALVETIAHLNYLLHRGRVTREKRDDGAWLWRAV
ncbi:MBL fold metallo-hydrolase [Rhodalgimonas zhirmunskyi]|uniref:MBL fold metallo-hydrolase n=1 Tax=Rhodalgimonas zhirmunskyi TaxID=2964767 RepID=A0AAJ1U9C2_9RHOB|nr:MBL fold metallo-hydrolase [Rhodoalgimonas zhirmunskyi]MDQ2093553.1 MBL fold metallo-hydrolase [Rhodoalgimonas zhirmunskyi]